MLIYSTAGESISESSAPPWVEEWLANRDARAKKKQEKAESPPKPVDAAAQEKRREQRLDRIGAGLDALKVWVEDLARGGIATLPGKGYSFFDEPARRMVDAQAPGAGRRIKQLGEIAASGAGWQDAFAASLSSLYLLIRAFENLDLLPAETQDDVLASLGITAKPDEGFNLTVVADTWQIVAHEISVEDRLRVQRTWLYGASTSRTAQILAFAHGTAPLDTSFPAGMTFKGEIGFHPGNGLRALIKSRKDLSPVEQFSGLTHLDELCEVAGGCFARQPWLEEFVAPLIGMTPVKTESGWTLVDHQNHSLPAKLNEKAGWKALAVSGGNPLDVIAGYDGQLVRPLAVMLSGKYISLAEPMAEGV